MGELSLLTPLSDEEMERQFERGPRGSWRLKASHPSAEDLSASDPPRRSRLADAGTFALEEKHVSEDALWGAGETVAMASGEPTMLVSPTGVGKTTLAQRFCLSAVGLGPSELLGMEVRGIDGLWLYVAADRPRQIARSARRMVLESDRQVLDQLVKVWPGPLDFDIGLEAAIRVPKEPRPKHRRGSWRHLERKTLPCAHRSRPAALRDG
jgi:hypothetical protein